MSVFDTIDCFAPTFDADWDWIPEHERLQPSVGDQKRERLSGHQCNPAGML
jgi:hypothetical protein